MDESVAPLEYRKAVTVEVRHPERVIDVLAVPYDEETRVMYRGRWITETIAPGAFSGVRERIVVNRGHDTEQPIGRVVRIHPNDPRGLRAEVKISNTRDGDDVLELAADELLGASIGFAPLAGGEEYSPDRTRRRVTKAFLAHIAMVGEPAYAGAKVLAVRAADPPPAAGATPNLDRILSERRLAALGMVLDATPAPGVTSR